MTSSIGVRGVGGAPPTNLERLVGQFKRVA
jgi:hypothetical protein